MEHASLSYFCSRLRPDGNFCRVKNSCKRWFPPTCTRFLSHFWQVKKEQKSETHLHFLQLRETPRVHRYGSHESGTKYVKYEACSLYFATYDIWTPMDRCVPAHFIQIKVPWLTLAHWGLFAEQSLHILFSDFDCKSPKTFLVAAFLSEELISTQYNGAIIKSEHHTCGSDHWVLCRIWTEIFKNWVIVLKKLRGVSRSRYSGSWALYRNNKFCEESWN